MLAAHARRPGQPVLARLGQLPRGRRGTAALTIALAALLAAPGCSGFRAEPAQGTFQPYRDPALFNAPAPPVPPPVLSQKLLYRARALLLTRCAAPLELTVRRIEAERRGTEVTVVLEAVVSNPHQVPVTVERTMKLRANRGVEIPFWQQFDGRRGRAVASNGGGLVLLPVDLRQNDGFTGPEQRTLPAGGRARTPTMTYRGLLGRGEERLLDLLVASSSTPRGATCQYRVELRQR